MAREIRTGQHFVVLLPGHQPFTVEITGYRRGLVTGLIIDGPWPEGQQEFKASLYFFGHSPNVKYVRGTGIVR